MNIWVWWLLMLGGILCVIGVAAGIEAEKHDD
jgi:hypothetical protein